MNDRRLDSWKEIAAYLGRQVRTVQGWERQEGLPVHRLPHKKLGSVFAYTQELDDWLALRSRSEPAPATAPAAPAMPGSPPPLHPFSWRRAAVWFAAALFLLAAGQLLWRRTHAGPNLAPPLSLARRYFLAATGERAHVRLLPAPPGSVRLVLSADGRRLYAANPAGLLTLISTRTGTVTEHWNIAPPLSALALAPDQRTLYLLSGNARLTVLNLASSRRRSLQFEGSTAGMALAPGGETLYVALPYAGLDRVDTRTLLRHHWLLPACPQNLAIAPDGRRVIVGFQCGGPGGREGHDALAVLDATTGHVLSYFAGPPRVGSPIAVSSDGGVLWSNSDSACIGPQFDHRGCPFVPASLLQVFSAQPLALLHTSAIPARTGLPQFGAITFLPGGERALDGSFLLSTSRYSRLEVLPADFSNVTSAVASRDGAHLYVALQRDGVSAIADFAATPAACSPPTRGLADWWPGDGSPDDVWGVVNARPSPPVMYLPGHLGEAFDFTRPNSFLTLGPDPALDFPLRNITLAAWVRFSSPGAAPVLDKPQSWYLGRSVDGLLQFCTTRHNASACLASAAHLADGAWYHVALTADTRGALSLYVDGVRQPAARVALSLTADAAPLYVAADPARHRFLSGSLDELMLYRRALGPADISRLAQMPACLAAHRGSAEKP